MSYRKLYAGRTEEEVVGASNRDSRGKHSRTICYIDQEEGCSLLLEFYDDENHNRNSNSLDGEIPYRRHPFNQYDELQHKIGMELRRQELDSVAIGKNGSCNISVGYGAYFKDFEDLADAYKLTDDEIKELKLKLLI